jgi:GAF domain-containing protein
LHVSASYVSLVDGERQFFKSAVGLSEPWASSRQTPLTHSFCKHAVASGEAFVVSDARENPLVSDNRAVSELGIVAYAGIPLTTAEGHTLGAFCVVDAQPRVWKDEEVEVLRSLAASVMTEIGTRRLADELTCLSADLQELVEARTIQLSRAEERWRVLLKVNNAVITCLDRETLFEAIATVLRDVIPFDRAALILDDASGGDFKILRIAGPTPLPPGVPPVSMWPRQGSRTQWIFEHQCPLLTSDLREDDRFNEHGPLVQQGFFSAPLGAAEGQGPGHRDAQRRQL